MCDRDQIASLFSRPVIARKLPRRPSISAPPQLPARNGLIWLESSRNRRELWPKFGTISLFFFLFQTRIVI
jgi:hypothetical protein